MTEFSTEELRIEVVQTKDVVSLKWLGTSRARNPGELLDPYLTKLISELTGKSVVVDFSGLEYMNSSSVSPIINFIKGLEDSRIKAVIRYNPTLSWQTASFVPLSTMIRSFQFVSIDGRT